MAPVKKSGSASRGGEKLASPLEGPISLLWAHQLRKEHALLVTRIDDLAETIRNEDAAAHVKAFSLDLKVAGGRISALEKEVDVHGLDLLAILGRLSSGDEALAEVKLQLLESEKHHKRRIQSLEADQKSLATQIKDLKATIASTSAAKVKQEQDQFRLLQEKMGELEARVMAEPEVTIVKDSIEHVPPPDFRKPQLVHNSNVSKKVNCSRPKTFSHASDLLQEIEAEGDNNIQTLYPFQREGTVSTDFDLDAGIATIGYARHLRGRRVQEESLVMLPEPPLVEEQQISNTDEHTDFQQGGAQMWDQYLQEGRNLVRRKEAAIVKAFVAGIADPVLRANCQNWLDRRVWSWENVESFPTHFEPPEPSPEPISTVEPTPEPTPEPTTKPQPTGRQGLRRKGTDSQAVTKELLKLHEDNDRRRVESIVICPNPKAGGNRRSQRISKKNDTVSQQADNGQQAAPAKTRSQHPSKLKEEPSKQPRNRRNKAVNDPEPPPNESGGRPSTQMQLMMTKAARLKQNVAPRETHVKDTKETSKPVTRTAPSRVENRDLQLEDIPDQDLRMKLRKMHDVFPGESLDICYEALLAAKGKYEDACQWVIDRTVQWRKRGKKNTAMHPSTPKRGTGLGDVRLISTLITATQVPDPYKTPEHRMQIDRTSYKRKLELSEEEQIANMKRARMANKKRGPQVPIRILPSSDTE